MLVHVEDLRKGDLILHSTNGKFAMYRLLADPRVDPKGRHTHLGKPRYLTLRVSCKRETRVSTSSWGGKTYTHSYHTYACTKEDHNHKKYIDPNYKEFWVLEREEEY